MSRPLRPQSTPRDMPLLPIYALVPYCPGKPSRRPPRKRPTRDLRYYPCSRRKSKKKSSGTCNRTEEYVNNSSSFMTQSEKDEEEKFWQEYLDEYQVLKGYVTPSKTTAKRVPKAKPGVADRFFSSQKKWSRFCNRNKGIRCAGGGPPSGGAAGAPQSP